MAALTQDAAGNFYGTAQLGGAQGAGTVFKLSAAGQQTVLYSFSGGLDGAKPASGVVRDSAGNLYGATINGGVSGMGVVYKIDTAHHESVLYSFTGGADGAYPNAIMRDGAGNIYGTTSSGGLGFGVVYKLDTNLHQTVLYTFTGGADGAYPESGLILDAEGNLYGTTSFGGAGSGVVFELDPLQHETVLHSFSATPKSDDGVDPRAGVVRDSAGNLYGTTWQGGAAGTGTVYKIDTTGTETVLYSFGREPDGSGPWGVILDSTGNLYGTTFAGGVSRQGIVFKIDPTGKETILYNFTGKPGGANPEAGLILDSTGNLYGTVALGGESGSGAVFKVDTAGNESLLYSFAGSTDGFEPKAGVLRDSAGHLYGTTPNGDAHGGGIVYELDSAGHETILYSFTGGKDGGTPYGGLIRDSAGNLYGTGATGGASRAGVVFKIDPAGNETVIYSFKGGLDGASPQAGVTLDAAGNLYGTTYAGGTFGEGVVFKIDPTGKESVLFNFVAAAGGEKPTAGVILDSAGNLYGTASGGGAFGYGTVYKLNPAGQQTVLYNFTGGQDGAIPLAGVILDSAGNLYGTTLAGGAGASGVVYKIDATGQESVLYSFSGTTDGANPNDIIRDAAGNFYGTTTAGGTGFGVVYTLDPSGQETVLYSFTGGQDGGSPNGGLALDSTGRLYGTTFAGGKRMNGTVFVLNP